MSPSNKTSTAARRKQAPAPRRRWPLILIGIGFGLIVLGSAGFVGASLVEENDSFCASCHTVPESTYFNRVTTVYNTPSAPIPDLASAHYRQAQAKNQSFQCINCHRGDASLSQRIETLALGAADILIYVSGKSNPTIEKTEITKAYLPNSACIKCHTDTLLTMRGLQSHFHNFLPQTAALVAQGKALVAGDTRGRFGRVRTVNVSLQCTDCHLAHISKDTDPQLKYMNRDYVQKSCDTCHQTAGERRHTIDQLLRGDD